MIITVMMNVVFTTVVNVMLAATTITVCNSMWMGWICVV